MQKVWGTGEGVKKSLKRSRNITKSIAQKTNNTLIIEKRLSERFLFLDKKNKYLKKNQIIE